MMVQLWRSRLYSAGFLLAYILHLAADGFYRWPALSLFSITATAAGVGLNQARWLRLGIAAGTFHALAFPLLDQVITNGKSLGTVIAVETIWPQLLVTLIGSRALSAESELSFAQFWQKPLLRHAAIEMQSIASAVAFGAFLTLVFYLMVPHALTPGAKNASAVIISAVMGGTIIHVSIIFLFFVIMAAILESIRHYLLDRSIVTSFCRIIVKSRADGLGVDLASVVTQRLSAAAHTRAVRLLKVAIETGGGQTSPGGLAALSLDGFRSASRQFIRTLLPLLPLLGFLGTVIGLATAIAELPHGLTDGSGKSFDISASLGGLAIKFETTLLGLLASMVASLALNYLEKREAELAAECMLVVESAAARS